MAKREKVLRGNALYLKLRAKTRLSISDDVQIKSCEAVTAVHVHGGCRSTVSKAVRDIATVSL